MIYLTKQKYQEIETKIKNIENREDSTNIFYIQEVRTLKEILSQSVIISVEESWEDVLSSTERDDCVYSCKNNYENGVIIQNKFGGLKK
jgi:hypothetical protein